MTKIILCGCQGNMGKTITSLACERDDIAIVAGVDIKNDLTTEYPIYSKINDVKEKADVISFALTISPSSFISGETDIAYSCSFTEITPSPV